MFEHLDDPAGPPPSGPLHTAVLGRVRHRRRRRAAVASGVAAVAVVGAGTVAQVRDRVRPEQVTIDTLAPTEDRPEVGAPMTVLMVGTDGLVPDAEGSRTDTIVLARVDPAAGEARVMFVPRDLEVSWQGDRARVNTVFDQGGPATLIEVLRAELGVEVDHYVEADFAGAVEVADALGGIRVSVDHPVRDEPTGLELTAGCHTLDGEQTLALGRARRVEVEVDGLWTDDPWSDLSRQARGMVVAVALVQAAGRVGPSDLPALVETGLRSVTVDDALGSRDLLALARQVEGLGVVGFSLPAVEVLTADDAVVLHLTDGAVDVVSAWHDGGSGPVGPVVDGQPVAEATGLRPC